MGSLLEPNRVVNSTATGQEMAKKPPREAKRASMGPTWGQDEAKRGQDGAKMSPREARKEPK